MATHKVTIESAGRKFVRHTSNLSETLASIRSAYHMSSTKVTVQALVPNPKTDWETGEYLDD